MLEIQNSSNSSISVLKISLKRSGQRIKSWCTCLIQRRPVQCKLHFFSAANQQSRTCEGRRLPARWVLDPGITDWQVDFLLKKYEKEMKGRKGPNEITWATLVRVYKSAIPVGSAFETPQTGGMHPYQKEPGLQQTFSPLWHLFSPHTPALHTPPPISNCLQLEDTPCPHILSKLHTHTWHELQRKFKFNSHILVTKIAYMNSVPEMLAAASRTHWRTTGFPPSSR